MERISRVVAGAGEPFGGRKAVFQPGRQQQRVTENERDTLGSSGRFGALIFTGDAGGGESEIRR